MLRYLLNRDVPYVFVHDHCPDDRLRWREYRLPLRVGGQNHVVEARRVAFDLQMTTPDFLNRLDEFDSLGIELFQSSKRIPDTLSLSRIDHDKRDRILLDSGVVTKFMLPHSNEVAVFWTTQREHVEGIVAIPEVHDLIIDEE
ncbi:MAG: hypothetical protein KJ060_02560 [Candidatus Hydrogenedentes bacterium]|nr:hypothetical protein [Candidatus Hydrogenedentota bacterium]